MENFLLCVWFLCQLCACLKYNAPISTFTHTTKSVQMRDILGLSLSYPPEPHVWPNLEGQLSRLIDMHCHSFFQLFLGMTAPKMQYLEPLFQLTKRNNMHYRYEWLEFASKFGYREIDNEELRQMLNDKRHVITTDYSGVYKITSHYFNFQAVQIFSNSGVISVEDIETFSGLIKLSVCRFNCGIMKIFDFLEKLPSTHSRLPRNVVIKFIIQTLILLTDKSIDSQRQLTDNSIEHERIVLVGSSLVQLCGEDCNDLKFLFDKTYSDSLKSASVELAGKILNSDNPSVDLTIICVILSLHVEDFPEYLTNSIAQKSREISGEMSNWEWLALAGIVVKASPPAPVNLDFNIFDTSKQEKCQMYLGATDMIYERLQKLPSVIPNEISAFSCLPMEQYRKFHLQNLPFPNYLPSSTNFPGISLVEYVYLLNTTFYWEISNNEEILRLMERLTSEALKKSSYLIVLPEDDGKYSVALRNMSEDEIKSPDELANREEVRDDMNLIVEIGLMQFYLQDKAVYRIKPHLLKVSAEVKIIHNLFWKELCSRSNLLSILFSNETSEA